MKKILAVLLCVTAILASSCVSSTTKQRLSDDECMIVMRAGTYRDNAGARSGRNYLLHVDEVDKYLNIPSTEDQYVYFKIYNDHTKIDKLIGRMKSGWEGQPFANDLNIELPYAPGELITLNLRVALELHKVGGSSYSSRVKFYEMTKEELSELSAEIKNNPDFESWF